MAVFGKKKANFHSSSFLWPELLTLNTYACIHGTFTKIKTCCIVRKS